jgi:hypothetical protein
VDDDGFDWAFTCSCSHRTECPNCGTDCAACAIEATRRYRARTTPAPARDYYKPQREQLAALALPELLKKAAAALRDWGSANTGAICSPTQGDFMLADELEKRSMGLI